MNTEDKNITGIKIIDSIFFEANINRYGISAILLVFVGCLGGVVVGLGGIDSVFQLSILATTTMFTMAMILAVAPMKIIVWSGIIAIISDLLLLAFNLLA